MIIALQGNRPIVVRAVFHHVEGGYSSSLSPAQIWGKFKISIQSFVCLETTLQSVGIV